jgi:hypothetical protein
MRRCTHRRTRVNGWMGSGQVDVHALLKRECVSLQTFFRKSLVASVRVKDYL